MQPLTELAREVQIVEVQSTKGYVLLASWCIHLSLAGYMEAYSYLVYTVWVVVALVLNWTPNLRQVPSKKLLKIKYKVSDCHVSQP